MHSKQITPSLFRMEMADGIKVFGGGQRSQQESLVIAPATPSVIFTVLLDGDLEFGYDQLECTLSAQPQAQVMAVNLVHPASFWRSVEKDQWVEKIHLVLPRTWFEAKPLEGGAFRTFYSAHLASACFDLPSVAAIEIQRLLRTPPPETIAKRIELEINIHQLLLQLMSQLCACEVTQAPHPSARQDVEMAEIVAFIETHLTQALTLEAIAEFAHMSVSSLQRLFKDHMNMTAAHYVRRRKLNDARVKLATGCMTVSEAAYSYGYRHPSNFSLAFKKQFGYSPNRVGENASIEHKEPRAKRVFTSECPT